MNLCACGCQQPMISLRKRVGRSQPRYLKGHNLRVRKLQIKSCPRCHIRFTPRVASQVCCSHICGVAWRAQKRRSRLTLLCTTCQKPFEVSTHRAQTAKFCSKECWSKRRRAYIKTCRTCTKSFDALDHRARFCSKACHRLWKTGPTSPVWKGGKSTQKLRGRLAPELAKWRIAVYQRDKHICQHCGAKPRDIHAHHIKPLADFPALALDIANGITLCVPCHEKVHGRTFGTPSQFPKHCIDCGKATSGRAFRCRGCGVRHAHEKNGHNPGRRCLHCHHTFRGRPTQQYCSTSCGLKARHQRSTS